MFFFTFSIAFLPTIDYTVIRERNRFRPTDKGEWPMSANIKDVARSCGLSISTVSKVFNG